MLFYKLNNTYNSEMLIDVGNYFCYLNVSCYHEVGQSLSLYICNKFIPSVVAFNSYLTGLID